ncbi:VOC family protein [Undibacterium sp. CY18W]|uniref:VOC family protein n=1 Tax=Undibacterium hunanense TaxID=2762292 RepID=A0ABR6ZQQ3_9BURK|nr:VOC family protein [Undibacterium hunanense]MBC3918200.1 VOC family protein [Undibacterium hunanense]
MPHPVAYLSFNGNCKEAMYFYEQTLGGKITVMMSGAESPMAAMMPPEAVNNILHARLELPDGGLLFAGDCPQHMPYEGIKGVSFTLNYDTTEEATRIFNALADGGNVTMPVQPAFWAKSWGMLVDKYGTPWIINGEPLPL